jgi:hypothetical protein
MALTTHPHLAPRLKKEQSYIYTPRLGLHGLFQGQLYLFSPYFLYFHQEAGLVMHLLAN